MNSKVLSFRLLVLFSAAILVGCSGSPPTAPIAGKVSQKGGKLVTGGSITFAPVAPPGVADPGKPVRTEIHADGTYEVDGALLGKHRVIYSPPDVQLPEGTSLREGQTAPRSPWEGLHPKDKEIEVVDGCNTIDLELVP